MYSLCLSVSFCARRKIERMLQATCARMQSLCASCGSVSKHMLGPKNLSLHATSLQGYQNHSETIAPSSLTAFRKRRAASFGIPQSLKSSTQSSSCISVRSQMSPATFKMCSLYCEKLFITSHSSTCIELKEASCSCHAPCKSTCCCVANIERRFQLWLQS